MSASTIELYWGSGSTPAWRALLGLHHKGLPYTSRLLSFSARETRSEAFLAINPRGKVPALVHGELRLNESLAILAYLDALQPAPPLSGQGAAEVDVHAVGVGAIEQRVGGVDGVAVPVEAVYVPFPQMLHAVAPPAE